MFEYIPGYSYQIVSGPFLWPLKTRVDLVEALLDMRVRRFAGGLWIRYKILGVPVWWMCAASCDGRTISNNSLAEWCGLGGVDGS